MIKSLLPLSLVFISSVASAATLTCTLGFQFGHEYFPASFSMPSSYIGTMDHTLTLQHEGKSYSYLMQVPDMEGEGGGDEADASLIMLNHRYFWCNATHCFENAQDTGAAIGALAGLQSVINAYESPAWAKARNALRYAEAYRQGELEEYNCKK